MFNCNSVLVFKYTGMLCQFYLFLISYLIVRFSHKLNNKHDIKSFDIYNIQVQYYSIVQRLIFYLAHKKRQQNINIYRGNTNVDIDLVSKISSYPTFLLKLSQRHNLYVDLIVNINYQLIFIINICINPSHNSHLFNEKIQFVRSSPLTRNVHISLRIGVGCSQLGQVPHLGLHLQTHLSEFPRCY